MEMVGPHRREDCGQRCSASSLLASRPSSERQTAPSCRTQSGNYKCSLCSEAFSEPAALERHFHVVHGGRDPRGPFPCAEQGCQFSSTDRQEYQAHLMSAHGLTLIPCTIHSCTVAFLTQAEMEAHLRGHMPFSCFHCPFVSQNVKDLSAHLLEHSHLPTCAQGNETAATAGRANGSQQPQVSGRPKRKRTCTPASSLPGDGSEEQPARQRHVVKRQRKAAERDKRPAVDAEPLSSKDYLAQGSEHIYRTHACPKCRRCFKMHSHLQEHMHLHFPDPCLQCPTCKRYFTSKSKLRIHRLREAGEKVHRCHLCEYSAVERNAIRRHLASVHSEEAVGGHSYPCPTCGQSFFQSRSLKAHIKTHDILPDSRPATCFQEGCSYQSPLRKELLRHTAEAHGVRAVECRHRACGAIFQSEAHMEAHYRTHLAYHCSQCDFSCSNKAVLLRHQRRGHPGDDELRCDFCPFVTFNPVEFEQHIERLHANETIHRCSQCSYMTPHKRGLKRHMLMHSGEKPHKCSLCDFRCRDESYLSKHMLTHSDDKNFMCAECGYVTKWKHYLSVHMRKHAGDLRYQCDQCPYRCHRMDQLNSHKLRHQAKSLMCEICAYACKRKHELRNHMLAKHSGEERQPAVYRCKYCAYTSSYRQALQNHENCKHTRLREFRCALCFYSSFSGISLFLHKRKAHGYVPGDKAWLENYAAKEKERNSTEFLQEFYVKPQTGQEPCERPAPGGRPPSQRDQSGRPGSAAPSAGGDAAACSQTADCVDEFDVASQEVVDEGISESPPSANSPEEYCTLVLTTLPATDSQTSALQNEEENCTDQTPSSPTLNCHGCDLSQGKALFSTSLSGENDVAVADVERRQSDLDDDSEPLNIAGRPAEPGERLARTPEVENDGGTTSSAVPSEQNQSLEPEVRLKAMKKHDKDQAEAMVLEGRVHVLVVPAGDVYRCDKCPYVTRKESALKYHCRSLCQARIKGHKCQACGAQFKQQRGLVSHLAKRCSAKTPTSVGFSDTEDNSAAGQGGSKQLVEDTNFDPTEHQSSQNKTSTESSDQVFNQQEEDVSASHPTGRKGFVPAFTSSESEHQRNSVQIRKSLKVKQTEKLFSVNKLRKAPAQSLYAEKDGRFRCKLCSFSSVRLVTVERHLSACWKMSRKGGNRIVSGVGDEHSGESVEEKEDLVEEDTERSGTVSEKRQTFSCPSCAFRCSQKRALDSHEKRGCLQSDEVQCTTCSFIAKSNTSLSRHILRAHSKGRSAKCLRCQHCTFTCKQERRLAQHVALQHKGARPHHCQYCAFSTARRYRLEEHESLHTGVGRHHCDACHKTFGAATKLRQHKTRIHDKQPAHFCPRCDFSGYTLDDVRRHDLRCHTGELRHACTHCDARFSSEVALRNHCKRVHQLHVRFSCKQCDYTCSSEVTLKTHQESRHPKAKCTLCHESFKTQQSLENHQKTHLAHPCQLCPFAAKTRHLLAQHLLKEHEEGRPEDKPLRCSACPFACRHQLVLEQHLRSHGGKRLYKCADCAYSSRNKQKMTWHIRIHTGEKPYSCEQCTYTCTDPARLKLHMRVHQEEKKYLCPECGYKCKWATQLKYHITKHTGDKPHACGECDYRTNRADALRAHRDTQHCDVRPYVCEKCGKAFKTSFILKTHQRRHSDDRPYACGLCAKAFRWPAGLRHHYLSHTKQQPFRCGRCTYTAKQKFQVVKHLKRHHPDVSVEQGVVRDAKAASLTLREALQGTLDERPAEVQEGEKRGKHRGEDRGEDRGEGRGEHRGEDSREDRGEHSKEDSREDRGEHRGEDSREDRGEHSKEDSREDRGEHRGKDSREDRGEHSKEDSREDRGEDSREDRGEHSKEDSREDRGEHSKEDSREDRGEDRGEHSREDSREDRGEHSREDRGEHSKEDSGEDSKTQWTADHS